MVHVGDQFETGELCPQSGIFIFSRYLDGTDFPVPREKERRVDLVEGAPFPLISSSAKHCIWKLIKLE